MSKFQSSHPRKSSGHLQKNAHKIDKGTSHFEINVVVFNFSQISLSQGRAIEIHKQIRYCPNAALINPRDLL